MSRRSFFLFCSSFFTLSFGVAAMAALVPSLAVYFGVSHERAAPLVWLYMLPYGVCALIWSPLTRSFSVKRILLGTMLAYSIVTFAFALSATLTQAYVFRFLMGCFGCSFVPLILITIGKAVATGDKSKYVGTLFGISYVSTCVSVFLSGFLPWRILYLVPATLSLAIFLIIPYVLQEFDFRRQGAVKISYRQTLTDRTALRFFLVVITVSFLYHSLQQWLGVYLKTGFGLSQVAISSILTVSMVSAMSMEFIGGILAARKGNVTLARAGFVLMSVFCAVLIFMRQYHLLYVMVILWGGGWALTHVGLSSHLAHFPDNILRDASSLNSSLRFFAGGLGAWLGGVSIAHLGYQAHFVIVGTGVCIIGLFLRRILYCPE